MENQYESFSLIKYRSVWVNEKTVEKSILIKNSVRIFRNSDSTLYHGVLLSIIVNNICISLLRHVNVCENKMVGRGTKYLLVSQRCF